jgi:hypothetical protein
MIQSLSRSFTIVSLAGTLLLLGSCATHRAEKDVATELEKAPAVQSRAELSRQISQEIEASKDLSDAQKKQLLDLREKTANDSAQIRQENLKLQALLSDEILSKNYNPAEVKVIETKMRKLEDQRLSSLFGSVEKANLILGRKTADNEFLLNHLIRQYEMHY